MSDYADRMAEELAQLQEKIGKLQIFTYGDVYSSLPFAVQYLITEQLAVMYKYRSILDARLSLC